MKSINSEARERLSELYCQVRVFEGQLEIAGWTLERVEKELSELYEMSCHEDEDTFLGYKLSEVIQFVHGAREKIKEVGDLWTVSSGKVESVG